MARDNAVDAGHTMTQPTPTDAERTLKLTSVDEIKTDMKAALNGGDDYTTIEDVIQEELNGTIIRERHIDTRRWHNVHETIFTTSGKHWSIKWRSPATEMQEVDKYDRLDDVETLVEVEPYTRTVTDYRKV